MPEQPVEFAPTRSNLELKARLYCLDTARKRAHEIATSVGSRQQQRDTYFHCPTGRFKLREIHNAKAQWIWYQRADEQGPKQSRYLIHSVSDASEMRNVLTRAYGIRVIVSKHREIFFYHNVRIHLDNVDKLGIFLEFEAVLGPDSENSHEHRQLKVLREHFGIASSDLLANSYGEQILAGQNSTGEAFSSS